MTLRPHIFTFYSYKGGVGRSMALLNVAYSLHSLGRHVLVVDLDLEAPGISGFLRRNNELEPTYEGKPDVVDLLVDLMPSIQTEIGDANPSNLPVLQKYLRRIRTDIDKYAPAKNPRFRRARLDVLSASDERNYATRLSALGISNLSGEELVTAGNLLREVFFNHQFPWSWEQNEKDQPTHYDYILIDSRTGFTETSGLCIGPLADRLVLFCGLNDQNINGTAEFLKVVGLSPTSQSEKWDDDDTQATTQSPSLGHKPTLLIASPIPSGEMGWKANRLAEMKKILGTEPDARISYHPLLSIIETVFCRDGAAETINREYQTITMFLLAMVGDHPDQWERRSNPQRSNPFGMMENADIKVFKRIASLMDEENLQRTANYYVLWANQLTNRAKQCPGAEADTLFDKALEKYKAAETIKPNNYEALCSWGNALTEQAKQKTGASKDSLFTKAGEIYESASKLETNNYEALYGWSMALSNQAKLSSRKDAYELRKKAIQIYESALALNPFETNGPEDSNWGIARYDQAVGIIESRTSPSLSIPGDRKQAPPTKTSDSQNSYSEWSMAKFDHENQKSEAEELYKLGRRLSDNAKQLTGSESEILVTAAMKKYKAALEIKPDHREALYHLACLHALRSDVDGCLGWLLRAMQEGELLFQQTLDEDVDFALVRNTPLFIAFREALPSSEPD